MDWRERVDASDSPNPSRSVIQSVKIGFTYGAVDDQVDGGGVVAALGPGPLPTLGVDGLGRADLPEQLFGAALLQQGQQLLPGGQLKQVDQPAGPVTQQHGRWRRLAGRVPVTAWLAAWGSAAATQ
jgi:hypothetical protein